MRVVQVPMLRDNYAYLLVGSGEAVFVDPADATKALGAAEREGARLVAVLSTHHHADHTGGNLELLRACPGLRIYGADADRARIPGITDLVRDGDALRVAGLAGRVLSVGAHTRGHVAYLFDHALFCGDALFSGGCGRLFEGSPADLYQALYRVIGALPNETLVYCGHEYTQQNLRFAKVIEPGNAALASKIAEVSALRAAGRPTVPTRLGEERRYNPFLRVHVEEVARAVAQRHPAISVDDPVAVLGALRLLKDSASG